MSVIVCACPRDRRCTRCVDQALMWFGGIACARGIHWAEDIARRQPALLNRPWPPHAGRAAALARTKIDDLTDDPQVLERLAVHVAQYAGRRWSELAAPAAP